jgi:hypothetical protein
MNHPSISDIYELPNPCNNAWRSFTFRCNADSVNAEHLAELRTFVPVIHDRVDDDKEVSRCNFTLVEPHRYRVDIYVDDIEVNEDSMPAWML